MTARSFSLAGIPPWILSASLHAMVVLLWLVVHGYFTSMGTREKIKVDFEVLIENHRQSPTPMVAVRPLLPPPPAPVDLKVQKKPRAVFGLSPKALLAENTGGSQEAVAIKQGNTLAQAPDQLQLQEGDLESLPIPVEEYLVSSMPVLKSEIRIPYPESARRAGVEGPVVMDLLIDTTGVVRQVILVQGLGYGLDEAAMGAAKQFRFRPAQVNQQSVAVKIRYTYRFVLESR